MARSNTCSLLALLSVSIFVPAGALAACSSDSGSTPVTGADASPTATTTTTAPADASPTATADASTQDAPVDAPTEAGACSAKGESDLKVLAANSGTDPANKVTAKMVDACDATTSAATAYTGTRVKFMPSNGNNHYFLIDPTDPANFFKSASVVFNYPLAGIRNDTDVKIVAKPGIGSASDSFGANYDATKVHFMVQLNKVAAACDVSGYTVSVVGHPEAVVQYSNGGNFTPDGALTTSAGTQGAFAFISKVNPGTGLVDIVGTKTGCKLVGITFPVAITTNKYPLIADTVTYLVANTSL